MSHKASELVDPSPSSSNDSNDLFINGFGCLTRPLKDWQSSGFLKALSPLPENCVFKIYLFIYLFSWGMRNTSQDFPFPGFPTLKITREIISG